MDALSMMKTAAVLLGIAAIGGLVMAVIRFRGADRPPTIVLMAHGLLAAAALTLLLYACFTVGLPASRWRRPASSWWSRSSAQR